MAVTPLLKASGKSELVVVAVPAPATEPILVQAVARIDDVILGSILLALVQTAVCRLFIKWSTDLLRPVVVQLPAFVKTELADEIVLVLVRT